MEILFPKVLIRKEDIMKKMYKKGLAWLLAFGLLSGILVGCQNKTEEKQKNLLQEPQSEQTGISGENQASDQSTGESKAMGRYGETEIALPEEVENQSLIQFIRGKDGMIELYTADREESSGTVINAFRYLYQNESWQQDIEWAGNAVLKEYGLDLMYVGYGQDGQYYMGGTDSDYRYHFLKLEEDGSVSELLEDAFKPNDGESYGLLPPRFEILQNGNILVYGYWEAYLYEPSGNRLFSIAKDFSGSTRDSRGFCEGEEFVTVHEDKIVRYNLRDGKIVETIDYGEIKGGIGTIELFSDGVGGIYGANEVGLSHINRGGNLWEILIDGSLNHMGMRSLSLNSFLMGENEDYYGIFTNAWGKGIQLFHYEYDPNLSSVPPSALIVYSLEDNSTVRQAASQFQSEHPEVRVDLRTAVEDGATVSEEMIQGLNTELLSGKGADILILDGLPVTSYIEKGVLMDISDVIKEMESSGDMLNNLLDGFLEDNGAMYQVPVRMEFPLILGEERAIQAYSSLKSMAEYQGEKPLFYTDNYENLLRKIARLRYEELFENENGLADKATLIHYLESVKSIGEASESKTSFSEQEMETKFITNNVTSNGMIGTAVHFDRGVCDSGIESIGSYMDLCIPAEVRNLHPEIQMVPAGSIYLPSTLAGVNQATANEEMAKEFIRCLLSFEVQKEELYDGFPVNKKALQAITENDREGFSVGSGFHGSEYHISAGYPSLEVRKEIAAMIEKLTIPTIVDETVMKMVVEGSRDYFDNKESAEQAADKILRKLSIYLAE